MVSNWAFQWKRNFNPNPNKQVQEVIFSQTLNKVPQPPLVLNNDVSHCKSQKHLGIMLDSKWTFEEHYNTVSSKTNRTVGRKEALITIYKVFVRPHLNCGDVPFD